jgi:hypothetical protein
MKFNIEIDTETSDPDTLGECLRNMFFAEEWSWYGPWSSGKYRKLGCYSTFEVAPGVEELPQRGAWSCFRHSNGIEMRYFWDGDGSLAFILPDGRVLINTDCKKTYDWRYEDSWGPGLDEWGS